MTKSRLETPDWSESDNCQLWNMYVLYVYNLLGYD